MKTPLTHSTSEGSSSTLTLLRHQNGNRPLHALGTQSNGKSQFEIPEVVPLTPQEEIIVKGVWNKLRAWKELQMEKFMKRLLLYKAELEHIFGEAPGSITDYFYEFCGVSELRYDKCVPGRFWLPDFPRFLSHSNDSLDRESGHPQT